MPLLWHFTLKLLYIYTSVFELLNVDLPVCLVVYPLEDFRRVWNRLICLIWPYYSLEAFVEGYRPWSIPYALEAIDESQYVLEPVRCIELVGGAVHQHIREAVRVEAVLLVCL